MIYNISNRIVETQTLPGWCPPEKAIKLAELILRYKPKILVETGIFGGRSLIPMAMACKTNGYGMCWGVDPWENEAAIEGEHAAADREWWEKVDLEGIHKAFVFGVFKFEVERFCRWLRMKSQVAAKCFEDNSIDFFHQDSNHSEEVGCAEVDLWHPKIKPGGIWAIDDLDWPTNEKAVKMVRALSCRTIWETEKWAIFQKA